MQNPTDPITPETPEVPAEPETPETETTPQAPQAPASPADDEAESTVFSAPVHEENTRPKGQKRLRNVFAALLALAVLAGGSLAVVRLIPVPTDDETSSTPTVTVVDHEKADIAAFTVTDASGNSVRGTSKPDDTASSGSNVMTWSLDGLESDLTDETTVESAAGAAASLAAVRQMTDESQDYGFAKPVLTVAVEGRNGLAPYRLLVGAESPDGTGSYVKVEGESAVYLVESANLSPLHTRPVDYATHTAFHAMTETDATSKYFDNGTLTSCESISLTNRNMPTHVFVPNPVDNDVTSFATYLVQSPVRRMADKIDTLLTLASTDTTCEGAYVLHPTQADLDRFGFRNPMATLSIKVGPVTRTIQVCEPPADAQGKGEAGLYYAAIDDQRRAIFKIGVATLAFADTSASTYYSKFLVLEMLSDLDRFTAQTADKTFDFSIAYDEEADTGEDFDILVDGKEIDQSKFQTFYQFFVGLEVVSYDTKPLGSVSPALTVRLHHHAAGVADTVLQLRPYEQRYQIEVDGNPLGMITEQTYRKLLDNLDKVSKNQEIPQS